MIRNQLKDNLIYPSIGKNVTLMKVNCKIDLRSPAYHYSSQQHPILQPNSKLRNQNAYLAAESNQNSARNQRKYHKSVYLPKALEQQDPDIYKNYLEMLKNNKIQSYIKFNIPMLQSQKSKMQLFSVLQKLLMKQKRQIFYKFKRLRGKQYISSGKSDACKIKQNNKFRSQYEQYFNNLDDSPIKITYQRVIINNQQQCQENGLTSRSKQRNHHFSMTHTHNKGDNTHSKKKYVRAKEVDEQNFTTNFIKQTQQKKLQHQNQFQDQFYTKSRRKSNKYKIFQEQSTNVNKKQKKLSSVTNYNTIQRQLNLNDQYNNFTTMYQNLKKSKNSMKNCQNCQYCLQKKACTINNQQDYELPSDC